MSRRISSPPPGSHYDEDTVLKITLINPPFLFPVKAEIALSHCLGLRSLSACLKQDGHVVEFLDALRLGFGNVKRYSHGYIAGLELDEIVRMIPADSDLIGLSVPFSQLAPVAHQLIEKIKARFPDIMTVMGGVYPSTQPRLALLSQADCIVVGEGETALGRLAKGHSPATITGVYRPVDKNLESFPTSEIIRDLDILSLPDYDIPCMDDYFTISPRNERRERTASLVTSRGCPFSCEFCSIHPVYGRNWRGRSAEKVLEEIACLNRVHGVTCLEFEDDNFTLQKERTVAILNGLITMNGAGAGISWNTPNGVRIDSLDSEVIDLIVRSNCTRIVLALEHGDPEMLGIMDKKLDLEKVFDVVRTLVEKGMERIVIFIIVGYPGETRERFENSLRFLSRIKALGGNVVVHPNIAQPYPGTALLKKCLAEGYVKDKEIDNYLIKKTLLSTGYTVSIETPDFNAREVRRRRDAIRELFVGRLRARLHGVESAVVPLLKRLLKR